MIILTQSKLSISNINYTYKFIYVLEKYDTIITYIPI